MGHQGATIREESTGKKCFNVRSILRLKHLQKMATWTGKEAPVRPLSAFFGRLLAAHAEAAGAPLDPFLFPCERCETILQPGYNCTVRIDKNEIKASTQNNIIYKCHFCSHRNLKGGTPTGHVKELLATKPRCISISQPRRSTDKKAGNGMKDSLAKGELYKNKKESIYLNSKSVSASEITSSGEIEAAKDLNKNRKVTPMEKTHMILSKKKSKVGISGLDREDASEGKILSKFKKSRKALCNLKETPKSSEYKTQKCRSSDNLVIPVEKKSSILSKRKRKASVSESDMHTAKNCFVATASDKARGTKRKRRKLLHVTDEIPKISEHQPLLSVHNKESPATPSEKLGEKASKKKKKVSVSGSDKQSACHNSSAATDSGKSVGGSCRRKRKLWYSLREIAERDEHRSTPSISNLANPFPLTPSRDAPIVKQKEQDCSMKLLNKQAKQKKTARSDKKLSSSKMPNGKGKMKCKEGQSAQASVSSTSNEPKSCVHQTDAIGGYHRNLVRSMNCLSTRNSSDFHFMSQQSAPVMTAHELQCCNLSSNASAGLQPPIAMAGHHPHCLSPGSNMAYTQLSPVVATNQLCYLSQGPCVSATTQSPMIMPSHQHHCLSQVSNVAAMQQNPAVMASDQLHFLALGPNMSAVQQSPIAIDGQQVHHLSQVCDRSAMLQSPIAMAGHQLHCLGQGPNMTIMHQSPVAMAAHQLHILGQASNLHCLQQSPVVISGHQIHHLNQESSGDAILQPPAFVTDHPLHSLSQEALMVAQPGLFPHYRDITGSSCYLQGQDGTSALGLYHLGQVQGMIPVGAVNPEGPHGISSLDLNNPGQVVLHHHGWL
ncbi:uncharacterized protein LOC103703120 isoform X2 [Phoenix dactylifera]|uniref:Uncharacterized protein LOC103703120 isoform X2 n=1 Tax=Phoenix dactylifera TaxID=42345 RepID=A0A8B9ALY9_PHODC|nr:uncharacterized protein LOC103703120 isoform X2 [Phoenix dactylifera]